MATSQISKNPGGILDLRKEKLRPYNQAQLRAKIQVAQIIKILHDHVVNGEDIAHTRLTTGLALLKKVLPDALPESVDNLAKAQAQIAQGQLYLMAQEMLAQQSASASLPASVNTLTEVSYTLAEDAHVIVDTPATVETSTGESE